MLTISIMGFADRATAAAFFEQAKSTPDIDAIFLDKGARLQYSKDLGDFRGVEPGAVFTVITFSPGTPIKLDTGAGAAEPQDESGASEASEDAAEDITGPEI